MPAVRRAGFWGNRTPVRGRSSGLSSHRAADGHLAAGANPSPEVLSREVRSACGPSIRHTCTVDRRRAGEAPPAPGRTERPRTCGRRAFAPLGSVGIPPVAEWGESACPPARGFPRAPAPRASPSLVLRAANRPVFDQSPPPAAVRQGPSAREAPNVVAQAGAARETLPGGGTRGVPGRHERHARGQAISRAGGEGGIPPSALRVKARRTRARRLGSPGKADGLRRREDRPPVQVRRLSGPQLT